MSTLQIQKDTGIKNISSLYEDIQGALSEGEELVLDFSDVQRVDLSVIQLIMSAQQHARKMESVIKIKNVSGDVREQLFIGGLIK
ncbi:MAG TPA: STAS domain-containing protein [Spirochaetota bacterium]|nr:STAS domain-containing protein [Spirochaetota bacterium]